MVKEINNVIRFMKLINKTIKKKNKFSKNIENDIRNIDNFIFSKELMIERLLKIIFSLSHIVSCYRIQNILKLKNKIFYLLYFSKKIIT